jgi:ferredoxin
MDVMPEVFEVREDNFLYLLTEEIRPDQEAKAHQAAAACPVAAISLKP